MHRAALSIVAFVAAVASWSACGGRADSKAEPDASRRADGSCLLADGTWRAPGETYRQPDGINYCGCADGSYLCTGIGGTSGTTGNVPILDSGGAVDASHDAHDGS